MDPELVDRLGDVLVDQAVATTRAVVGGVALEALAVAVALEALVEDAAHVSLPARAVIFSTISFCCGNTPPKRCTR